MCGVYESGKLSDKSLQEAPSQTCDSDYTGTLRCAFSRFISQVYTTQTILGMLLVVLGVLLALLRQTRRLEVIAKHGGLKYNYLCGRRPKLKKM